MPFRVPAPLGAAPTGRRPPCAGSSAPFWLGTPCRGGQLAANQSVPKGRQAYEKERRDIARPARPACPLSARPRGGKAIGHTQGDARRGACCQAADGRAPHRLRSSLQAQHKVAHGWASTRACGGAGRRPAHLSEETARSKAASLAATSMERPIRLSSAALVASAHRARASRRRFLGCHNAIS